MAPEPKDQIDPKDKRDRDRAREEATERARTGEMEPGVRVNPLPDKKPGEKQDR